jgi:hypothetical protein
MPQPVIKVVEAPSADSIEIVIGSFRTWQYNFSSQEPILCKEIIPSPPLNPSASRINITAN